MDEQLKNIYDKWKEAQYHYKNMQKISEKISGEYSADILQESIDYFRYEFNAFVNSGMSVTYVIQKTYRNKFEKFESWYTKKQEELKNNKFAKTIHSLRILNQKEGNYYPLISKVLNLNKNFNFAIDYSAVPSGSYLNEKISKHIVGFKFIPISDQIISYDNNQDGTLEETLESMKNFGINYLFKKMSEIKEEDFINAKLLSYNIILEENGENLTFEDFFSKCKDYLNYLRDISLESEKIFLK